MTSVVLPLLRLPGLRWLLLDGLLIASVLTWTTEVLDRQPGGWRWELLLFWLSVAFGGLMSLSMTQAQNSLRTAMLPGIARRLRIELSSILTLFVLTVMLACGAVGWVGDAGGLGTIGALSCLGLALGLGGLDPFGLIRWGGYYFILFNFVIFGGPLLTWTESYSTLARIFAGVLLAYSVSRWVRLDLLRERPHRLDGVFSWSLSTEPHGLPQPPFAMPWLSKRVFQPPEGVHGLHRWRAVSQYASYDRLRWGRFGVLVLPTVATLVIALVFTILDNSQDMAVGFSVLFGMLTAFFFGGALLEGSRLHRAILYPISRRERAHLAYAEGASHLGFVVTAGLVVASLVMMLVSHFREWDWAQWFLPIGVHCFIILAVVAPIIQWPAVTGRNDFRDQGMAPVAIRVDMGQVAIRAVCMFLLALLNWFVRPNSATGPMMVLYLPALALSQGLFFAALRKHFATTDLVPIPTS